MRAARRIGVAQALLAAGSVIERLERHAGAAVTSIDLREVWTGIDLPSVALRRTRLQHALEAAAFAPGSGIERRIGVCAGLEGSEESGRGRRASRTGPGFPSRPGSRRRLAFHGQVACWASPLPFAAGLSTGGSSRRMSSDSTRRSGAVLRPREAHSGSCRSTGIGFTSSSRSGRVREAALAMTDPAARRVYFGKWHPELEAMIEAAPEPGDAEPLMWRDPRAGGGAMRSSSAMRPMPPRRRSPRAQPCLRTLPPLASCWPRFRCSGARCAPKAARSSRSMGAEDVDLTSRRHRQEVGAWTKYRSYDYVNVSASNLLAFCVM